MGFLGQVFSGGTTNGSATTVPQNSNIQNFQNNAQYQAAQGGVGNAINQQQALQGWLQSQNALGNQSNVFNQQQGLANQLQAETQGAGPNPAQAQLAQNTGANVANQAALMAGQRGAAANPALIARQAAQQGAATQQNAVGQAATLQAQQQLAAQQQLGQQQQNMANLANTQAGNLIGNQQNVLGANQNNLNTNLGALQNQNQMYAGIQNVQQQGQNELNAGNQKEGDTLLNSVLGGGANGAGGASTGGGGGGGGGLLKLVGLAQGGKVGNPKLNAVPQKDRFMPSHLKDMSMLYHDTSYNTPEYQEQSKPMNTGGDVGSKLKEGGKVPGKAKMSGDHKQNDTVAAKLSPGEVVIPKSVMESDDPAAGAAQFVAALAKKKGSDKGAHEGEFREALKKAISGRKSK